MRLRPGITNCYFNWKEVIDHVAGVVLVMLARLNVAIGIFSTGQQCVLTPLIRRNPMVILKLRGKLAPPDRPSIVRKNGSNCLHRATVRGVSAKGEGAGQNSGEQVSLPTPICLS